MIAGVRFDLLPKESSEHHIVHFRGALSLGHSTATSMLNLAIAEDRASEDRGQRLMRMMSVQSSDWEEPVLREAESLRAACNQPGAERAYRDVLAHSPTRSEALLALGGLLLTRGRADAACDLIVRACRVRPNSAEAWNTLGISLCAKGMFDAGKTAFSTAQTLNGARLDYVLNAVEMTPNAVDGEPELTWVTSACLRHPHNPAALIGRGLRLESLGRRSEAIKILEAGSEMTPGELLPLRLLGAILARSSMVSKSERILRRLRRLDKHNAQICNDHAAVLMRLHQHAEARTILLDIVERHGHHTSVVCNLANATACVGNQNDAVALSRQAITLDPLAVLPRRALCNTLPYKEGTTGKLLLTAMKNCSIALPRSVQPILMNKPDPDRPLTIGLLSGSLRSHPVGWLTVAGIETLDPRQFRIICLTQHTALVDPICRRYQAAASDWIEVESLNDAALTALARQRGIDIMIDLGGYGDSARMPICANRLAPVQIKWVGMQGHSSGLKEMDWFLSDRWETPDGFDSLYSERLLRLPDGYVCYSPPSHAPDVQDLPALKNNFVTFGCFNNLAKITSSVIEAWAAVLRAVPASKLILKTHQLSNPALVNSLREEFVALGIVGGRIEFRGSSGHRSFLSEYSQVDLVLDPFPYSGGLTTCEALWMGVPTITLAGEIFASRHSSSHLSNGGLSEWVAGSLENYIEIAVFWAAHLAMLSTVRAGLREKVRRSPLCDGFRFGRSLGAALRHCWREWCTKQHVIQQYPPTDRGSP